MEKMTKDEKNFYIYLGQMLTFKTFIFISIYCNKNAFLSN